MNVYVKSNFNLLCGTRCSYLMSNPEVCLTPTPILSCHMLILLSPVLPRPFPTPGSGEAAHVRVVNWQPSGGHPHQVPL